MDDTTDSKQDGHRHLTKSRVMGKLFGREKKPASNNDNDSQVSAFLHGPSDKLFMMPSSGPPRFPKLDTTNASRWPTAAEVNRTRDSSRARSASLKRSKKGLIVRFTDRQPEIIGLGGEEADSPTLAISERKRSYSHPPIIQRTLQNNESAKQMEYRVTDDLASDFRPMPIRRTQTGHASIPESQQDLRPKPPYPLDDVSLKTVANSKSLENGPSNSISFSARVKAEMRAAEGMAFKQASMTSETSRTMLSSDLASRRKDLAHSPLPIRSGSPPKSVVPPQLTPGLPLQDVSDGARPTSSGTTPGDSVASGREAVEDFSTRVRHLFKLFELSAESVIPISRSSLKSLVRAASWWFLKGRANIETSIRSQPSSSEGQRSYAVLRQQAHADVAKSLWMVKEVISHRAELQMRQTDDLADLILASQSAGDESLADILDRCQTITVSLQRLVISMQRNDCLPPLAEDAPLPQGLDTSVWIRYPSFQSDVTAVLSGQDPSALRTRIAPFESKMSDALPLGDSRKRFEYSRMFVDVFLMEPDAESQQVRCPSILFVSRSHTEKSLMITISSQDGAIALFLKPDGSTAPTWNDLRWQTRINALDVKLLGGFVVRVQLLPNDFKTLWNMYDYTSRIHASFRPRQDEDVLFEMAIKTFQYFDGNPQNRIFPKDPMPTCQIRILEKFLGESNGNRSDKKHGGFRLSVITGAAVKNLNGMTYELALGRPLQFGFLRGEGGAPALLLKVEDSSKKASMVLTFQNVLDRTGFHSCITGGVGKNEKILASVPIKEFSISGLNQSTYLEKLEWQGVQVIGRGLDDDSEHGSKDALPIKPSRIVVDSKSAHVTDRINFKPGDLWIRLNTQLSSHELIVLRKQQEDMSISVLESQSAKDMPLEAAKLLDYILKSRSVRKYQFHEIGNLHKFEEAVTGFCVLFDGLAQGFAISRRRTVVPIHKRWEASLTRLQLLRHDNTVQLAVFFENFSHGECMNFVLKGTDVFEAFSRSGKSCLRIVDAKFALPKGEDADVGIDTSFICLDMPEYPGEHDDITVVFDSESERDKFAKSLPAPVRAVSRLGTVRKS